MGSSFRAEVRRRGWTTPRGDEEPAVVLMDGGRLYIPDSEYADFLAVYAARAFDEPLYVIERPSQYMRFYADFDVMHDGGAHDAPAAYVTALAQAFALSAAQHLQTDSPTVVLRAIKASSEAAAAPQKIGIHLIMPRTRVTAAEAERVREAILGDLIQARALAPPTNGWDDAFDKSVYRQGGLRLVASRKMVPCQCGTASLAPCTHRRGRVDAGRAYTLVHVVDAQGARDDTWTQKLRYNPALCVVMSSIRTSRRDGDPRPRDDDDDDNAKKKKQRRTLVASGTPSSTTSSLRLQDCCHQVHARHRDLIVESRVRLNDMRVALRVRGDGDAERYCPNVERCHSSSSIYYVADGTQGVMRCACRCRKGSCPTYASPALSLTAHGAVALGIATTGVARGLPPGFAA